MEIWTNWDVRVSSTENLQGQNKYKIIPIVVVSALKKLIDIKMPRTDRICLDARVLRLIIKPRPSFGFFGTVI